MTIRRLKSNEKQPHSVSDVRYIKQKMVILTNIVIESIKWVNAGVHSTNEVEINVVLFMG